MRVVYHGTALVLVFSMACLPLAAWAQARVAFVTSASGSSDLKTWEAAGDGLTGLQAADSICVNLAEAGGLDNPGNFVAWLSDSVDDAYCRVHHLTGKRAANCGEEQLPASAGPWVRTDGAPFGAAIADLLAPLHTVYTPLWLDETGAMVPDPMAAVWTATGIEGELSGPTCSDWDDTPAGGGGMGWVDRTSLSWTSFGTQGCGGPGHLYCLEREAGPALELPVPGARLAFVTEAVGTGDLGSWPMADENAEGLAAGDSICRNSAMQAGLAYPEGYRAWLSAAGVNAGDRFDHDGAWHRLDGMQVAANLADLTKGTLFTAINQDESGKYRTNETVWTGTNPDGTAHTENCASWQSTVGNGQGGRPNVTSGDWTSQDTLECAFGFARLYCLADFEPPLIFRDGFEDLAP